MSTPRERTTKRREIAGTKKNFVQAFKQAPWRLQVQSIGLFLLALVIVLLVSSVYLSISGRAATAGLNAYQLNLKRLDLEREIADRKAQIAIVTSSSIMEERAKAMGFERINPEEAVYVTVPEYTGKQSVILAPPPGLTEINRVLIKGAYRQSLWDWLFSGINRLSESVSGGTS